MNYVYNIHALSSHYFCNIPHAPVTQGYEPYIVPLWPLVVPFTCRGKGIFSSHFNKHVVVVLNSCDQINVWKLQQRITVYTQWDFVIYDTCGSAK